MLRVDDLTHRYGTVTALDAVSFDVPGGRVCGFLGPNGAGKTTAMRAIMGVLRPDTGTVTVHGAPEVTATARRRR